MSHKTSHSHVNITIYAIILIIGALFIPIQFSYANTTASTYYLQGVISHVCDQTMSTTKTLPYQGYMVGGCSVGASYRAVQDEQQTTSNRNSNSSDAFAGFAGICSDRRHCPSSASTP
jgi:hypothetical protein